MNRAISTTALVLGMLAAVTGAQANTKGDVMANGKSIHGEAVAMAPQNARVINLDGRTVANVTCGEVVTFQSGAKSFTWKFMSTGHRAVDVRAIAPAGFSDKKLMVYVSRNESERA